MATATSAIAGFFMKFSLFFESLAAHFDGLKNLLSCRGTSIEWDIV